MEHPSWELALICDGSILALRLSFDNNSARRSTAIVNVCADGTNSRWRAYSASLYRNQDTAELTRDVLDEGVAQVHEVEEAVVPDDRLEETGYGTLR